MYAVSAADFAAQGVPFGALQVFYPDADDVTAAAATCDPWHGLVADIGSHDDQAQDSMGEEPGEGDGEVHGEQAVQADPYGCGGLWERFLVLWQPNTQVGGSSHAWSLL